jgi:hypothetical protein
VPTRWLTNSELEVDGGAFANRHDAGLTHGVVLAISIKVDTNLDSRRHDNVLIDDCIADDCAALNSNAWQ